MASWKWPNVLNKMLDDIPGINVLLNALLKQDVSGTTDVPTGAKQWVDTPEGKQFQVFNGQSWGSVGKLAHDAASVDGHSASTGTTASTIPVRDANGKLPGDITGNAATATKAAALSSTNPIGTGGTGATTVEQARNNLGVPPTNHASAGTDFGIGNASKYGHLKLSNSTNSTLNMDGGTAATPIAVKTAKENAISIADEALRAFADAQSTKDAEQDAAIVAAQSSAGAAQSSADAAIAQAGEFMELLDGKADKTQLDEKENKGAVRSVNGVNADAAGGIDGVGYPTEAFIEYSLPNNTTFTYEYTAPANGYFTGAANAVNRNASIVLTNVSNGINSAGNVGEYAVGEIRVFVPAKKGQLVRIYCYHVSSPVTWYNFKFVHGG